MTYDYFYGQQAEMFAFYRVPKVLFTEDCFWNVSTDAKLLYGKAAEMQQYYSDCAPSSVTSISFFNSLRD